MSSRSHARTLAKQRDREEQRKKKYYDANTLTLKEVIQEIYAWRGTGFVGLTSTLAIGEALWNRILKMQERKMSQDTISITLATEFLGILMELKEQKCLRVVNAKGVKDQLSKVTAILDSLDISDAYHFAIAVKNQCVRFVSTDPDITQIRNDKINEIKTRFNLRDFKIEKKQIRNEVGND